MTSEAISVPYQGFRQGRCRVSGYCLADRDDRASLAFEPWFAETDRPNAMPCLRLDLVGC